MNQRAGNFDLMRLVAASPVVRTVVPEDRTALQEATYVGGRVIAKYIQDAHGVARVFERDYGDESYETKIAQLCKSVYERDIEALGANARAKVERKYTWNKAFQGQMAAYKALLGRERVVVPATDTELAEPS